MVTLKLKFGRRNAAARVLPWLQFLLLGIYPCTCSLVPTPGSLAPGSRVAIVRSPQELQDAARDGVPHIVVVEHLDMSGAPTVARLDGLQSLNSALIRVRRGTVSIVGRCGESAPPSFQLSEPLPVGACAIVVEEDFLDVPLDNDQLWVDSLYVAISSPGNGNSSVLCLQTGGLLWVTNCVLQGAGSFSRAFDVNTLDNGNPRLFVADTTVTTYTFKRLEAPGILMWPEALVTLRSVLFRNISVVAKDFFPSIEAVTISLHPGAGLLLQEVVFDENTWFGNAVQHQQVAAKFDADKSPAEVFASPPLGVWLSPGGPENMSQPIAAAASSRFNFLLSDTSLVAIQDDQAVALTVDASTGTDPAAAVTVPNEGPRGVSTPAAFPPGPSGPQPVPAPLPAGSQHAKAMSVASPQGLQDAAIGSVRHIVITDHLDMTNTLPEMSNTGGRGGWTFNRALLRVRQNTRSIVGRCNSAAPPSFRLSQPLPPGACAVLLNQAFLEVPTDKVHLWVDSIYVVMTTPAIAASPVLFKQIDGFVWVTNSVLQGPGSSFRAFDVGTSGDGSPKLFVGDTTVTNFTSNKVPGVFVWPTANVTLKNVTFRNMALEGDPNSVIPVQATSVGVYHGGGVLLEDVAFEGGTWHGEELRDRAVAVDVSWPFHSAPGRVFAQPEVRFWLSPRGPGNVSEPIWDILLYGSTFLDDDTDLRYIQYEQRSEVAPGLNGGAEPRERHRESDSSGPRAPPQERIAVRSQHGMRTRSAIPQAALAWMVAGAAIATATVFAACMAVVVITVLQWNWARLLRQSTQSAAGGGAAASLSVDGASADDRSAIAVEDTSADARSLLQLQEDSEINIARHLSTVTELPCEEA